MLSKCLKARIASQHAQTGMKEVWLSNRAEDDFPAFNVDFQVERLTLAVFVDN